MFLHELWCQMPNASLKSKSCIITVFFLVALYFYFILNEFADFFDIYELYWKSGKFVIFRSTSSFTFFISYICFCWLMFCYRIRLSLKEKEDLTNDWINLNHFSLICIPQCYLSESLLVLYFILNNLVFSITIMRVFLYSLSALSFMWICYFRAGEDVGFHYHFFFQHFLNTLCHYFPYI